MLNKYIKHARNFKFMSGVERDNRRVKHTAEVFTPTSLVQEMVDKLEKQDPELFSNPEKTFLDNSCGDGQFLSEVVIRKMQKSNCSLKQALRTTYGVELMEDNVRLCRKRLAGPEPDEEIWEIVNNNIVHADALEYDYSFGQPIGIEKWCE